MLSLTFRPESDMVGSLSVQEEYESDGDEDVWTNW
jgi:hypothetical protein